MTLKLLGVCACGHERALHTWGIGCFPLGIDCACQRFVSELADAASAIPEPQQTCIDCPRVVRLPETRCGEHALLAAGGF